MKATFPRFLVFGLSTSLAMTSACAEQRVEPAPTPTTAATQAPIPATPAPKPQPVPPQAPQIDWRAAKITPGDWSWSKTGGKSTASFASGLFIMRCDKASGAIALLRRGAAQSPVPMTIITASTTRPLSAAAAAPPSQYLTLSLPARDPLLDAMAFSRGRFVVEMSGLPTLYIPSWPEVSRVIEDCR